VHVCAGVTDEAHTGFLRDPLGLHVGDQGGAEAVETLLRLAALAGGGTLRVDAGLLHELDELRADPSSAAKILAGKGGQNVVGELGLAE